MTDDDPASVAGFIREQLLHSTPPPMPKKTAGSEGVVTAAGGISLVLNAWLLCSRLRAVGCELPVEVFHRASEAIPARIVEAFPRGVRFREVSEDTPGFAIKPLALWKSSFDRCLWLDADNLPFRDPGSLFGRVDEAAFWPDAFLHAAPRFLAAFRLSVSSEIESGQMSVPTLASRRALWLTRELNERYRALSYRYLLGDKDTFAIGWALASTAFRVCEKLPWVVGDRTLKVSLGRTTAKLRLPGAPREGVGLVQRDDQGEPLFLHRTVREWCLFDRHEQLSWMQRVDAPVRASAAWRPPVPEPLPPAVRDLIAWAQEELRRIEWFVTVFPSNAWERLWLRRRYQLEAALATIASVRRSEL